MTLVCLTRLQIHKTGLKPNDHWELPGRWYTSNLRRWEIQIFLGISNFLYEDVTRTLLLPGGWELFGEITKIASILQYRATLNTKEDDQIYVSFPWLIKFSGKAYSSPWGWSSPIFPHSMASLSEKKIAVTHICHTCIALCIDVCAPLPMCEFHRDQRKF